MGIKQVRSLALGLALLAGCNGQLFGGVNLAGLQFKPATQERLLQFSGTFGNKAGDAATPTAAPLAPIAEGMVARSYPIWGGGMGNFTLVSSEEATSDGISGSFMEVQSKVLSLVNSWAPDAKLSSVWGNEGGTSESGMVPGWSFSYWSPSLLQSLNIHATAKETIIFKQTWKTLELDSQQVIDSVKVKALVIAAITDKNFTPPVEQPSTDNKPIPVADATQLAPPPPSERAYPQETELFEVPENAAWQYNLYQENNRLIWNVNIESYSAVIMYGRPMATPAVQESASGGSDTPAAEPTAAPQPDYYIAGGWARVDAKTGEIQALTRPRKISNGYVGRTEPGTAPATK